VQTVSAGAPKVRPATSTIQPGVASLAGSARPSRRPATKARTATMVSATSIAAIIHTAVAQGQQEARERGPAQARRPGIRKAQGQANGAGQKQVAERDLQALAMGAVVAGEEGIRDQQDHDHREPQALEADDRHQRARQRVLV